MLGPHKRHSIINVQNCFANDQVMRLKKKKLKQIARRKKIKGNKISVDEEAVTVSF